MPIYEYACKSCGERLEVAQSFSDEPLTTCTVCGGPLRKVYGSIGIAFKGSGFYRTDARPGAAKAERERDGKAEKLEKDGKGEKAEKAEKTDKAKPESMPAKADKASSGDSSGSSSSSDGAKPAKVKSA